MIRTGSLERGPSGRQAASPFGPVPFMRHPTPPQCLLCGIDPPESASHAASISGFSGRRCLEVNRRDRRNSRVLKEQVKISLPTAAAREAILGPENCRSDAAWLPVLPVGCRSGVGNMSWFTKGCFRSGSGAMGRVRPLPRRRRPAWLGHCGNNREGRNRSRGCLWGLDDPAAVGEPVGCRSSAGCRGRERGTCRPLTGTRLDCNGEICKMIRKSSLLFR